MKLGGSKSSEIVHAQDRALSERIQFWTLLGPWLIVATVLIAVLKPEAPTALAFIAVGGMLACWKYRMGGLWASLALIALFEIVTLGSVEIQERFWHLGTGISLSLALSVTTLALEEVKELTHRLSIESGSRLEALIQTDDRLKTHEKAWKEEREALLTKVKNDQEELARNEKRIQTFQRMVSFVRKDLELADTNQHKLQELLVEKERTIRALEQEIALLKTGPYSQS